MGEPSLREQSLEKEIRRREDAAALPLVKAILAAFPGATIETVRDLTGTGASADNDADHGIGDALDPDSGEDA
jgi:DNA polymerase-3 subunit gamma/tau